MERGGRTAAGWAVLPGVSVLSVFPVLSLLPAVLVGVLPHGALLSPASLATLLAASVALALGAVLLRGDLRPVVPVRVAGSARARPGGVPRQVPRAFDPDTAGRPRPRAPGRSATPSH